MSDITNASKKSGRPRSEDARKAILEATNRLIEHQPVRLLTIAGVAKEAQVGKPTIYRWWDSKCALVTEAFLFETAPKIPILKSGSAIKALGKQLNCVVGLMNQRTGKIIAEMIGEGQSDPHILEEFRERFFLSFLAPARDAIEKGKESGEINPKIDACLAIDLLYGPVFYRLLVRHQPLDKAFARGILEQVMPQLQGTG